MKNILMTMVLVLTGLMVDLPACSPARTVCAAESPSQAGGVPGTFDHGHDLSAGGG